MHERLENMRVIGGIYRHRKLLWPADSSIRPTKDRIREAIFSSLGPLDNMSFLDLFGGSGAMGPPRRDRPARPHDAGRIPRAAGRLHRRPGVGGQRRIAGDPRIPRLRPDRLPRADRTPLPSAVPRDQRPEGDRRRVFAAWEDGVARRRAG